MEDTKFKHLQSFSAFAEALGRLKDLPKRNHPREEVFGIPQRAYGYLTPSFKENYRIDKLQTRNVISCVFLSGANENGAFLAHLDKASIEQVPAMMSHLEYVLGDSYEMTIVTQHSLQGQEYVPQLIEMLTPFAKQLEQKKKGNLQMLRIGTDLQGELFYPGQWSHAVNEGLDELEAWFETRGPMPDGSYRTSLDCFNEVDGFYIPPEAFEEDAAYQWLWCHKNRNELVRLVTNLFPDKVKHGKLIEMVKRRRGCRELEEGMLIPI